MITRTAQFSVERSMMFNGLRLYYAEKDEHNVVSVAQPLILEPNESGNIVTPLMTMDEDMAQRLINELWIAGCRPSKPLRDPHNSEHLEGEIGYLRGTLDKFVNHKLGIKND